MSFLSVTNFARSSAGYFYMPELFGEKLECFSGDVQVVPCISNPLHDKNAPLSPSKNQNLSPVMDNSVITHVS